MIHQFPVNCGLCCCTCKWAGNKLKSNRLWLSFVSYFLSYFSLFFSLLHSTSFTFVFHRGPWICLCYFNLSFCFSMSHANFFLFFIFIFYFFLFCFISISFPCQTLIWLIFLVTLITCIPFVIYSFVMAFLFLLVIHFNWYSFMFCVLHQR